MKELPHGDGAKVQLSKASLRQMLLHKRAQTTPETVKSASRQIAEQILAHEKFADRAQIHVYMPLAKSGEIDTRTVIALLQGSYPDLSLSWGYQRRDAPMPRAKFDVIFVPVVGFNRDGFRLGFGGGWYDRFLANQPQARKIGLAYGWSEVQFAPEPHDIRLDEIYTD